MRLECLSSNNSHCDQTWEGENCSYLIKNCKYFNNDNNIVLIITFPPRYNFLPVSFAFITNQNEVWVCYNYDPSTNLILL